MKKFKYIFPFIFFLISINFLAQNAIPIPFLQPYDSYEYDENVPAYNTLETESEGYVHPMNICPLSNIVSNAKGYSWDITSRNDDPNKGNALKLTVHPDDHPCHADEPRSRAETTFNLPNENNNAVYIRWDLLIPNDDEFMDELATGGSEGGPYHNLFQIISRSPSFNHPLVGLYYQHNAMAQSNFRDLRFLIISPHETNSDEIRTRIHITNAVEKGKWAEITYRTYWSDDENIGNVQVWIDGKPVIQHPMTPSNGDVLQGIVSNSSAGTPLQAIIATKVPTYENYIKFGHYRRYHLLNHSTYIDNVKVTHNFPPTEIPIQLLSQYCDQQIDISDQNIECEQVTGATNYKFRFEKGGDYNWVDSASPRINLLDYDFLQPGETYNVQVRAQGNDFDFNYGEICTITTAKHTKLRSVDCNNLNSHEFNGQIGALKVHNATNYKFRFQRLGEPTRYFDSPNTFMTPSSVSGLSYYKEYIVDVRASGIGFDFNYGETCIIRFDNPFITRSQSNTRIYPNPTSDELNIKSEQQIQSIQVVDVFGNLKRVDILNNFSGVNTQKLSKGLYFIQINYGDYQEHLSFVKD